MAKRARTPQEKKKLSYTRDRRNVQGRSTAGTRAGIPAFKRRSNRTMRHSSKVALVELAEEVSERADTKLAVRTYKGLHPSKRKIPDAPLSKALEYRKERRDRAVNHKEKAKALIEKRNAHEAEQRQLYLEKQAHRKATRQAKRRAAAKALKKVGQQ